MNILHATNEAASQLVVCSYFFFLATNFSKNNSKNLITTWVTSSTALIYFFRTCPAFWIFCMFTIYDNLRCELLQSNDLIDLTWQRYKIEAVLIKMSTIFSIPITFLFKTRFTSRYLKCNGCSHFHIAFNHCIAVWFYD